MSGVIKIGLGAGRRELAAEALAEVFEPLFPDIGFEHGAVDDAARRAAMLHFEHFHFQTELLGNTYSIIYGNSAGAVHVGDNVTIVMADGLQLHHVIASN